MLIQSQKPAETQAEQGTNAIAQRDLCQPCSQAAEGCDNADQHAIQGMDEAKMPSTGIHATDRVL
jgi:hypothetical protein